jgi:nucleoside phosphorylase
MSRVNSDYSKSQETLVGETGLVLPSIIPILESKPIHPTKQLDHKAYSIAWICSILDDYAAAQEMLDEEHVELEKAADDTNLYSVGEMQGHNIVITCIAPGSTGVGQSTRTIPQLKKTYPNIRFSLIVGISSGMPVSDIRLGDVVVSQPSAVNGGVIVYDTDKRASSLPDWNYLLDPPPQVVINAITQVRTDHMRKTAKMKEYIAAASDRPAFSRASAGPDLLFQNSYKHVGTQRSCDACVKTNLVSRSVRESTNKVLYGKIGLGKKAYDGAWRDQLGKDLGGVLCLDSQASGLNKSFPCVNIRGIFNYCDSHWLGSASWAGFASIAAAAYAKELLSAIPDAEVQKLPTINQVLEKAG